MIRRAPGDILYTLPLGESQVLEYALTLRRRHGPS
jgi:hypothetical protein